MKSTLNTTAKVLQVFSSSIHLSLNLVVSPAAAVTAGAPVIAPGKFAAASYTAAIPAVLFTLAGCRIVRSLSLFGRSFLYSEEELQKLGLFKTRLRFHALLDALTAVQLIHYGIAAYQANSFSAAFGLGCLGMGAMAAVDCLHLLCFLTNKNISPQERQDARIGAVGHGIEAAGWLTLMSNPLLGASFLIIGWLFKAYCAPKTVSIICKNISTIKSTFFNPNTENNNRLDASPAPAPASGSLSK